MLPMQVQSGVAKASPFTTPDQHAGMLQGMKQFGQQMGAKPVAAGNSAAAQAMQRNFAGNTRINTGNNAHQFDRMATQANAQENLRSQQAQAKSGQGWMQQGLAGYQQQIQAQQAKQAQDAQMRSLMLSLFGSLQG